MCHNPCPWQWHTWQMQWIEKLKSAKIFSLTNVIILPVIIIRLILKVGLSLWWTIIIDANNVCVCVFFSCLFSETQTDSVLSDSTEMANCQRPLAVHQSGSSAWYLLLAVLPVSCWQSIIRKLLCHLTFEAHHHMAAGYSR